LDWHDILAILSPTITLFILVIGGVVSYYAMYGELKNRITRLETQMQPFWTIIEKEIPKLLHSPHTPEIDVLLDKMSQGILTIEEAKDLRNRLKYELEIPDSGKKIAIILLLTRLDQIINGVK